MPAQIDITGQRFGKLIALRKVESRKGKTYWLCQCDCGNQKEVQTSHLTLGQTKSCGCLNKGEKPKEEFCLNCGIKLHKGQYKYCCSKCQREYERNIYIEKVNKGEENGLKKTGNTYKISDNIRSYLLQKYDNKCQKCGWGKINPITGKCPLEIHHVDGNHVNNKLDNLELLCPNCHSLTKNYKYLNSKKYKQDHQEELKK